MVTAIKLSLQEKPKLKPKTTTTARLSTSGAAMPEQKLDSSEQFKDLYQKGLEEQNRQQENQKNLALRVSRIQKSIQQKVSKSDVRDIVKAEVSDLWKSTKAATQEMMESSERKLREELSRQHDQREEVRNMCTSLVSI